MTNDFKHLKLNDEMFILDCIKMCYLSYEEPKYINSLYSLVKSDILKTNKQKILRETNGKVSKFIDLLLNMTNKPIYFEGLQNVQNITNLDKIINKKRQHICINGYFFETKENIIICFRGTSFSNPKEVIEDLECSKVDFDIIKDYVPKVPKVHEGFYNSLKTVTNIIDNYIEKYIKKTNKKIYVTGHSLGASVAIYTSLYLQLKYSNKEFGVVTFGTPKTAGDILFKNIFEKNLDFSYHFINNNDAVPCYPFGFESVENLIWIDGEKVKRPEKNRIPRVISNFFYSLFGWSMGPIDSHHIYNYVDSLSKVYVNLYTIEDNENEEDTEDNIDKNI